MDVAIIFAVVFVPFFIFIFLMWRMGRKMPESAFAHLEKAVYRIEPGRNPAAEITSSLLLGVPLVMLIFAGAVIVSQKTDPVYILPGIKECLVAIYLLVLILPITAVGIGGAHNTRMMKRVALDLDPENGIIEWDSQGKKYSLHKEDFEQINTVFRDGRLLEMVNEFVLKNGEKLYLTFSHPGYQALMSMLKNVPRTEKRYYLPIVPVDVPPVLRITKKVVDITIRYCIVEGAVIVFSLLCIFALHYYEKGQKNLDQLLPAREVTDFAFNRFLKLLLGLSAAALFGRICWLWQKRRKQAVL
ncbi:MAG: hypothetical protein ABS46_04905 [Cytophagaceae bacterium SCN 52-12]|nr:MAG: hypothetical protein ABS46_04905 [Cytophagaceae bacterium SCN 52-12]